MSSTKEHDKVSIEKEKSKFGSTDVYEWHMELRTNNMCMNEHNVDVKMKKIEAFEKSEAQERQDRDMAYAERERTNLERENTNLVRERANEERERTNNIREMANDEKECTNKDREIANDKHRRRKDDLDTGKFYKN
jgi:hypothetical protein